LLTLDEPRKDDIPTVNPLKSDVKASPAASNDLHRLIGKVLGDMTGNPVPESSGDLMKFIQRSYKKLFGRASPRL
jgi:hypothetical protein